MIEYNRIEPNRTEQHIIEYNGIAQNIRESIRIAQDRIDRNRIA